MEHIYRKIALLVDAESIDSEWLHDIILQLSTQGQVVTRQVFGDWSNEKLSGWVSAARIHGARLIHQPCYTRDGSEVPILMSLYATELFQQQDIDTIAIATNREEFTPLATYLRETGAYTMLCHTLIVSSVFQSAFDEDFICSTYGQLVAPSQDMFVTVHKLALEVNEAQHQPDGYTDISILGTYLKRKLPKLKFSSLEVKGLRDFVLAYPQYYQVKNRYGGIYYQCTRRLKEDLSTPAPGDVGPKKKQQEEFPTNSLSTEKAQYQSPEEIDEIIIRDAHKKRNGLTALCTTCGDLMPYTIQGQLVTQSACGIQFSYTEQIATCSVCGKEVYVPEVHDWNIRVRIAAFREAQQAEENKKTEKAVQTTQNDDIVLGLTDKQRAALDYIRNHPNSTCRDLEDVLSVKTSQARRVMRQLWMSGLVGFSLGRNQEKHYFLKSTASSDVVAPKPTDK